MSNRTYILKKDLPDSKAGDIYIFNESSKVYYKNGNVQDSYWHPENVENNLEWFEEYVFKSVFPGRIYTEEQLRKSFDAGFKLGTNKYAKSPTPFEDFLKTL